MHAGGLHFMNQGNNTYTILVTSPELARDFLRKQDVIFASRPYNMSGKLASNGYLTAVLSSMGDQWKKMRRIVASEDKMNFGFAYTHIRLDDQLLHIFFDGAICAWPVRAFLRQSTMGKPIGLGGRGGVLRSFIVFSVKALRTNHLSVQKTCPNAIDMARNLEIRLKMNHNLYLLPSICQISGQRRCTSLTLGAPSLAKPLLNAKFGKKQLAISIT
ncbi:Tryptophan N-monooxygenase [Sesamum angolense]|uniref:Tryptophan N-monooxygenase n=1 Tax=Sesamum angolense TaxID=2727404 RepID=A0AAE2BKB7_9LAMI|nr:Tryptophan N-monooxygenase [Sesamum angolense]